MNNTTIFNVTKRDGTIQPFDLEKVHKVLDWAVEGISGVSISEIELKANIQLYDKIKAYDIHELLIKSAAELISEHTPNYQFVAARLISYKMRKEAYGDYNVPHLINIIQTNVNLGVYDPDILEKYTEEELNELNEYIRHDSDDTFTFSKTWSKIFLYGKLVNDFNVLDKQKIFAVHHAAIQELDRINTEQAQRIQTLETQLADVIARLTALENA